MKCETAIEMPDRTITFVTGNQKKLQEFVSILGPNINFNVRYVNLIIILSPELYVPAGSKSCVFCTPSLIRVPFYF